MTDAIQKKTGEEIERGDMNKNFENSLILRRMMLTAHLYFYRQIPPKQNLPRSTNQPNQKWWKMAVRKKGRQMKNILGEIKNMKARTKEWISIDFKLTRNKLSYY